MAGCARGRWANSSRCRAAHARPAAARNSPSSPSTTPTRWRLIDRPRCGSTAAASRPCRAWSSPPPTRRMRSGWSGLFVFLREHERAPRVVTALQLPAELASQWDEWLPPFALWLPVGHAAAGLATPSPPPGGTAARGRRRLERRGRRRARRMDGELAPRLARPRRRAGAGRSAACCRPCAARRGPCRGGSGARLLVAAAVAALMCVPVRLSVLAPGELVPSHPAVIRAPVDGVIGQVDVEPNQAVKGRAGAVRLRRRVHRLAPGRDGAGPRHRAGRVPATGAAGRVGRALQAASSRCCSARSRRSAPRPTSTPRKLQRSHVTAPIDGIALFDDPSDWIGKPVQTGERVMRIAAPRRRGGGGVAGHRRRDRAGRRRALAPVPRQRSRSRRWTRACATSRTTPSPGRTAATPTGVRARLARLGASGLAHLAGARCGRRRRRRRKWHRRRRCRRHDRRGRGTGRRRGRRRGANGHRRIEQQGVLAHEPPVAHEISRITSMNGSCTPRSLARRMKRRPSARFSMQRRLGGRQHRVVVDVGGAIGLRRRDPDLQVRLLLGRHAGDFDLGLHRFAER